MLPNIFAHPAFSMAQLTAAINLIPNSYDKLGSMGLFPDKPQRLRTIVVEMKNNVLTLLPTLPPGSPGTVGTRGRRNVRSFVIPHIPHDDVVLPQEVEGIRAFGSETELMTVAGVMAEKLQTMRNKHAITLEHLRFGALKGQILDADGSVLYDLYDEFGVEQHVVKFDFTKANADPKGDHIRQTCVQLKRDMEDRLQGERMSNIAILVGEEFFDALTSCKQVKDAYQLWLQGEALRADMRSGFPFGGLTFEEHRGRASDSEGVVRRFIEPDEGQAFPLGTMETFATYYAPADFNETVNTVAQPLYAKQAPRPFERGTDLHTQSNPLPLCHRPGLLIKLEIA